MLEFRLLNADEIEVRLATINEKGATLLLYKDARVDQNILDETVGPMNWQRHHARDNANCIVSIWDEAKSQWIEKEDTGTESFTEKEKGLASDSFKRACFNWGIGRELYSAPFIWVPIEDLNAYKDAKGKWKCYDNFAVTEIMYSEDRKISYLKVINTKTKAEVFSTDRTKSKKAPQKQAKCSPKALITKEQVNTLTEKMIAKNVAESVVCESYGIKSINELPAECFANCFARLEVSGA